MERLVTRIGNEPAVPTEIDMDFVFEFDRVTFNGLQRIFNQLCDFTDILGDDYDLDRLHELIEADRAGKLLVWPSEKVYVTDVANGKITEQDVCSVHLHKDQNNSAIVTGYSVEERNVSDVYRTKRRNFSQLGKTVFFTMDAANAALKGEQHE